MPEFHPSQDKDFRTPAGRIILGSFPPYKFTRKDEKEAIEQEIRSRHFYGNKINQFWKWYQQFVDLTLVPEDIESRNKSLEKYDIDVADVIYSCERKGQSASDNDLSNRCYHLDFLDFSRNDTVRLLCTSKGVMNEMFFGRNFRKSYPDFSEDPAASKELARRIAHAVPGTPIARVFRNTSGKSIEAVALPSPGSPYRSLKSFGFVGGDAKVFLQGYLKSSFEWFLAK